MKLNVWWHGDAVYTSVCTKATLPITPELNQSYFFGIKKMLLKYKMMTNIRSWCSKKKYCTKSILFFGKKQLKEFILMLYWVWVEKNIQVYFIGLFFGTFCTLCCVDAPLQQQQGEQEWHKERLQRPKFREKFSFQQSLVLHYQSCLHCKSEKKFALANLRPCLLALQFRCSQSKNDESFLFSKKVLNLRTWYLIV